MLDTKLKPVYKEWTFWILLAMSIPGIIAAYAAAWHGVRTGTLDTDTFYTTILSLPVVVYLGVGRQYARGKAVEAAPMLAAVNPVPVESNPPVEHPEGPGLNPELGFADDDEYLLDYTTSEES